MSKTKVYIDGQAGTTGLQIFDRIGAREDLELMRIDEDKRHDNEELPRHTALLTAGPTVSRSCPLTSAQPSRAAAELPTPAAMPQASSPARLR